MAVRIGGALCGCGGRFGRGGGSTTESTSSRERRQRHPAYITSIVKQDHELRAELAELERQRDNLTTKIRALRKKLGNGRGGTSDDLVVYMEDFRPILDEWIEKHPYSTMADFARQLQMHQSQLRAILNQRKWITLRKAEEICENLDVPWLTSTLPIHPNPLLKKPPPSQFYEE